MSLILGGSLAFSIGAAFMKASQGLTRLTPTLVVIISSLIGVAFLAKAVRVTSTSTTIVVGLGFEALLTVAIGICLLGDRVSPRQAAGMILVIAGVALVSK